jgi:hypothetical protein
MKEKGMNIHALLFAANYLNISLRTLINGSCELVYTSLLLEGRIIRTKCLDNKAFVHLVRKEEFAYAL